MAAPHASGAAPRLRFGTAAELFQQLPTALADISATPSQAAPLDFLATLARSPTPENAITFAAYLLTAREAVWWGCQCLVSLPAFLSGEDRGMLGLAENWVRQPDETQRNAALEAGLAARAKTPAAFIALGAGWSGGSMQPASEYPVPAPPYLAPRAVNAAVLGTLASVERTHRAATLAAFVRMADQLVR